MTRSGLNRLAFSSTARGWAWLLLAGMCLLLAQLAQAQQPQLNLPRVQLQAGMHLINAQVAQTPQQIETGLMWRRDMPANEGMLFVFARPQRQCFWMKNTYLPLTAAFLDDDGAIVNLADMQAGSTDLHCSAKPVRFVLEMHQGWFARRGIGVGQRVRGDMFMPR